MPRRSQGAAARFPLALLEAVVALFGPLLADITLAEERLPVIEVTAPAPSTYLAPAATAGIFGRLDPLDSPYAIVGYASELLENQQTRTLVELLKNDPAVQDFALGGNFDHLAIRGFPMDTRAGYRRDGLPFVALADPPLETVERIDVLHGASALLYGFNRPAGVVNLVSKRPTAEPRFRATAQRHQHQGYYAHLDAAGPLAQAHGLNQRWNIASEKIGDFTHAGDLERWMIGGAWDWRIDDRMQIAFNAGFQHKSLVAQPQLPPLPDGRLPAPPDPHDLLGQPWARYQSDAWNLSAKVDYQLSDTWTLTAQLALDDNRRDSVFPNIYDLTPQGDILEGDFWYAPDQRARILASQALLSGRIETGPIAHELTFGIATYRFDADNMGYVWPPLLTGNIYHPQHHDRPSIGPLPPKRPERNRQRDLFLADQIRLNEQWRLIGGLRYADYDDRVYKAEDRKLLREYQEQTLTPGVALLFKPRDRLSLYASYGEALEPGGLAPISHNVVNAGDKMPPLISEQYEVGLKALPLDDLELSAALFRIDRPLQYLNDENRYVEEGLQRHQGLELAIRGSLTPRLNLLAGLAWLDPRIERTGNAALQGNRPAGVAERMASLLLEYRLPQLPGLTASLGAYHRSDSYFDQKNSLQVPGYTRYDLGLRYQTRWQDHPIIWRLNVENLGDRFYWASSAWDGLSLGIPRTARLSLEIEL